MQAIQGSCVSTPHSTPSPGAMRPLLNPSCVQCRQQVAAMKPSDEDLAFLEANSRFTNREIHELYGDAKSDTLTRAQFNEMLDKSAVCDGPEGGRIRDRLFASADRDASGMVSMRETCVMLSKCAPPHPPLKNPLLPSVALYLWYVYSSLSVSTRTWC